jgi:hypothetical protein
MKEKNELPDFVLCEIKHSTITNAQIFRQNICHFADFDEVLDNFFKFVYGDIL